MNFLSGVSIPIQTIRLIIILLAGLLIIVLAGILPMQRALARVDEGIKGTERKINEQHTLAPIHQLFEERLKKGQKQFSTELVIPNAEKLPRDQVQNLTRTVRDLSGKAGMQTVNVSPQLTPSDGSGSFSVTHVMQGDFMRFRNYLVALCQLPYYDRIDEIKIEETVTGLLYTVKLRVIIS